MSKTKWTDEQLSAIDTRNCNLLVAAAAGSGKTAVLVERIIRIITNEENPVDIDKLLVVTFTNAAAAEMRERIASAISKALDKNPNSKNLQKQLTLLNRSNITTMQSFCLDVIKNNFHNESFLENNDVHYDYVIMNPPYNGKEKGEDFYEIKTKENNEKRKCYNFNSVGGNNSSVINTCRSKY